MAFDEEATLKRDQPPGPPVTENGASGRGGAARTATHPYVQAALLALVALATWKLAGVLLLLFSAILLAAALLALLAEQWLR